MGGLLPADLGLTPRSGLVLFVQRALGLTMINLPLLVGAGLVVGLGLLAAGSSLAPWAVGAGGLLLAVDLGVAWVRWRRIFLQELPDDRAVQDSALRNPLTDRTGAGAASGRLDSVRIEGLVMRRLSLGQWMKFVYSLRLDYLLNDLWRGGVHGVRRLALGFGVGRARRWSPCYGPHWEDIGLQLGELILETSLCTGIASSYVHPETGALVGVFRCDDWTSPAGPRFPQEAVHIATLEFHVDLEARRGLDCLLNGRSIGPSADALVLAFHALTIYLHPVLHAHANWACVPEHRDPVLAQAAIYTLGLNGVAWDVAYLSTRNPKTLRRLMERNIRQGIQRHGTGPLFRLLAEHSRFGAFALKAKKATMQVLREHEVQVDPEAFFLMAVLHSVDHHCCSLAVDPLALRSELLGDRVAEVVRVLFVEPLLPVFADLRLSRQTAPWLIDLRERLRAIDPDLAGYVDCSIMC